MPVSLVALLVNLFLLYVAVGVIFAAIFVWRGVGIVDPVAAEGTWGFRILILPGCAAFWPWLLRRWLRAETPRDETNPHRRAARARAARARAGAES